MKHRREAQRAFSLVEVSLALGLMAVILTSLIALLPMGVGSTREAADEAKAVEFLTLVESELRSTRGVVISPEFGLPLPYVRDAQGRNIFNPALVENTVHTVVITTEGKIVPATQHAASQVTLVYTSIPTASSMAPLQARLIANWPSIGLPASPNDLTDNRRVNGFVESYLLFPAP